HSRSGKFFLDEEEWNEFQEVSTKELRKNELKFFEALNNQYREWNRSDLPTMGSNAYAMDAVKREMNIQGLLNLESIGYTSTKFHSQTLPAGMSLDSFETYNLDKDSMIGNFIAIVGNKTSSFLAQTFFRNAQHSMIKLPCVNLSVPLNYDQIRQIMPDLLRSDHGPFWKYGIPAIMLTDTANFRNPYYHTTADTIDTLDFVFLKRVCQAVLATILRFPS
ncbi:MAG: M28 family peptidase, partial [Candidatus Hodarchaeota archaeon]